MTRRKPEIRPWLSLARRWRLWRGTRNRLSRVSTPLSAADRHAARGTPGVSASIASRRHSSRRVIQDLTSAGTVKLTPTTVALAGHEVRLSGEEAALAERLGRQLLEAGLSGIAIGSDALAGRVVRVLVAEGTAVRLGEGLLVSRESLSGLVEMLRSRFPPGSKVDVAALKEMTGLSRKWVIPLFELLDRERVTRRAGDVRLVLGP